MRDQEITELIKENEKLYQENQRLRDVNLMLRKEIGALEHAMAQIRKSQEPQKPSPH